MRRALPILFLLAASAVAIAQVGGGDIGGNAGGISEAAADTRYVNAAGDAMTGDLDAQAALKNTTANNGGQVYFNDAAGVRTSSGIQTSEVASGGDAHVLDTTSAFSAGYLMRVREAGTDVFTVDHSGGGQFGLTGASRVTLGEFCLDTNGTAAGGDLYQFSTSSSCPGMVAGRKMSFDILGNASAVFIGTNAGAWFLTAASAADISLTTSGGGSTAITAVKIGGGTRITESVRASATIDFASIAAQTCVTNTITVTGAAANDETSCSIPAAIENGLSATCWVSSADTVSVRLCNVTTGAIDPASGTYSARTWAP